MAPEYEILHNFFFDRNVDGWEFLKEPKNVVFRGIMLENSQYSRIIPKTTGTDRHCLGALCEYLHLAIVPARSHC